MEVAGVIRGIDNVGRLVLPKEIRDSLGLEPGTQVKIFLTDDEGILIKKFIPTFNIYKKADELSRALESIDLTDEDIHEVREHMQALKEIFGEYEI